MSLPHDIGLNRVSQTLRQPLVWMVVVLVLGAVGYMSRETHSWEGVVAANSGRLPANTRIGSFRTLAECRTAATEVISQMNSTAAAYSCGRGCRNEGFGPPTPGYTPVHICKEIVDGP